MIYNNKLITYTVSIEERRKRLKHLTRKNLLLALFTILSLLCVFLLSYNPNETTPLIKIGNLQLPENVRGGIISGINSLLYILLVFTDYKKGFKIAFSLMLISFGNLILGMIFSHSLVSLPGLMTHIVSIITLITIYTFYKKLSESNLTDYITGQHNRRSYVSEINEKIDTKQSFTVACIELEYFKHINDLYGIQTADFILQKTAEKIKTILNRKDKLFRITGSTFAILFEPGESPEERLKSIISPETITVPSSITASKTETNCTVTLGAGIVYSHPPYNSKQTASYVLSLAETALATTRNMEETKICIYNEDMENTEAKNREAEFLIKKALKNNLFFLVYQPQYSTTEKKLRGFETLVRCRNPDCSIVTPNVFIPIAEKSNLIMQIDNLVLKSAMKEFKPLLENSDLPLTISINISAKNIGSPDFIPRLKKIINETQFPIENLELEITEYSFADNTETAISNIKELKNIGIHIALDDFGTGYTSIKQLMTMPVNILKIDKSLIDELDKNQRMRDMIDSVIYMGHLMNCEVISEGVEKDEQVDFLTEHKCDFIQGFVWGKPISFEEAKQLVKQEDF